MARKVFPMTKKPAIVRVASDLAGSIIGLQNRFFGFDSLRSLQKMAIRFHPEWAPKWAFRDGKRIGPFVFSTKWTSLDDLSWQIFGNRAEQFRKDIEASAFSKAYEAPDNPVHPARDVIRSLEAERNKWRDEAIAARKEISALKRAGK